MSRPLPAAAVRDHLGFLDGLRGLAALYVAAHHAAIVVPPRTLGRGALQFASYFYMGHAAVSVFIVLSGYCLMLPVVRSADGRLRGGFRGYIARRARRILPAYYATLGLCLVLAAVIPALRHRGGTLWDLALPIFRGDVVVSHLLLVHNLRVRWFYRIDPPLWSVATEWQIYFLFPALLWVWRRKGAAASVAVAFAVGYGIASLPALLGAKPGPRVLTMLCPWYLGLFALGMAGAVVGFSTDARARWCKQRIPWGVPTLALGAAAFMRQRSHGDALLVNDTLVGLATACLLIFCQVCEGLPTSAGRPPILRLLSSRWAVALGGFSYSLYLLNYPLVALVYLATRDSIASPEACLAVSLGAGVPLVLAASYLFHLVFERGVVGVEPARAGRLVRVLRSVPRRIIAHPPGAVLRHRRRGVRVESDVEAEAPRSNQ